MEAKTWTLSDAVAQLEVDPWRKENPFSADIVHAHEGLFDPTKSRQEMADALSRWLAEYQPCLFGRIEAKLNRLAFCILNENDMERSDQEIRAKIERERIDWKRTASLGESHGFLIVAISEQIALARPDARLHALASRLCELYLGANDSDTFHLDNLILETVDDRKAKWRQWPVGVNYFSAQADGRWWRDHRVPGGMAFSMNSVGHMARTQVERKLQANPELAARHQNIAREKLVYWALRKAMETIAPPTEKSTRGTWLAKRGTCPEDRETPAFEERRSLFGELAHFSENRYRGRYHTDHTIPSVYFDEGLWRVEDLPVRDDLYFTYLHSLSDDDYHKMGIGLELAEDQTGL